MVTLAIWGEVTPGAILTTCCMWGDMVDVITCAIFGDCRLRGVGVVRGVNLPSPINLTSRPYNTGHTIPCDRACDRAQSYEQFLLVGRLHRALILLGLALCFLSASVFFAYILLFTFELSLVGLALDVVD